ncbi:hypothetical protein BCR43DRAFT_460538 [Syncephalastrum racemosum]|uniref:Stress-response A/B barrel domain-containing protein n=1 Tax=Syncephalastrum racemosum TaxID=13706 RepID=A0A1X2H888_SYNRA|nr:hypothetical protein BCR43DRAFT_460538 [Syncephalastrum racemosum]
MSRLVHIVIAKFKPEVDEATRQAACNQILALKDKIPGVLSASAGKTFTDRSQGFEWGWVFEFKTKEELPLYTNHPAHQEFLKNNKPLFADLIALDYMC